jgi:hypothetical protein
MCSEVSNVDMYGQQNKHLPLEGVRDIATPGAKGTSSKYEQETWTARSEMKGEEKAKQSIS